MYLAVSEFFQIFNQSNPIMKKLKFPTAQTILFTIAGMVALLTWFVPAGEYDNLSYNAVDHTFERINSEGSTSLPASQETLEKLKIKIPLEKFTSGDIYKPISIPNTYKNLDSKPQGFAAFVQSPIKGIIEAADPVLLPG